MGVERCVRLDGLTEPQISKKLEEVVKAGEALKAWCHMNLASSI